MKTNTFTSYRTRKTFKLFYQVNCKSLYVIFWLQCRICQLQYVGKSPTSFKNPILACKRFQNLNHNFQKEAKFTLIEQFTKTFTTTEQLWILLKKRENVLFKNWKHCTQLVLTKNLTTFRSSFTVIFCLKLGIHVFIIGSRNITATTIELLKNVTYMASNFPVVNIIHKY